MPKIVRGQKQLTAEQEAYAQQFVQERIEAMLSTKLIDEKDSSTERQYYLRVPPSITHADEVVAWTFGLDEPDYQPLQEA